MGQELSKKYVADCRPHVLEVMEGEGGTGRRAELANLHNFLLSGPNTTYIVFDWDDTLLCSTAINMQRTASQLKDLERACLSILQTSMSIAETLIVTNGNATWVMDSASRFMPGSLPVLQKLTVVSARALFESTHPMDPFMWKKAAFLHLFVKERAVPAGKTGMNLIALGDQLPEIEAAQDVGKVIGGTSVVKTLKFKEAPSVPELLGQLAKAELELVALVNEPASMNRGLERRPLPSHLEHFLSHAQGWALCDRDEDRASSLSKSLGLNDLWALFH